MNSNNDQQRQVEGLIVLYLPQFPRALIKTEFMANLIKY